MAMAAMTRLRPEPRHLPLALALLAAAAQAQQGEGGGPGRGALQPRLSVSQTWTDNLRLTEQNKDAAIVTTVSPGVSISRNTGSVRGSLDYSLNGITYIKSDSGTRIQNALSANMQAEIIPQTFSVQAQAAIGQQSGSAFGLQSTPTLGSQGSVSSLDNPNSHETGTLNVSPLLHTQLGGVATVDLRGNLAVTEVRGSSLGDSRSTGATLSVAQLTPGLLSWYFQAVTQQSRPKGAQSNRSSSLLGGLNYRPDPDWTFSTNVGKERSNYRSQAGSSDNGVTWGASADWAPTSRTHVSSSYQRHAYGDSRSLTFEHRMRNSVWRYSDSRSVSVGNVGALGGVRTNYDLYFLLLTSLEPDPVKRDVLVRAALQSLGLSPDAPASLGFLSTGPSQVHSQMLSFTLQGVRSNVTALVSRAVTTRLADGLNQGDLATSGLIQQTSYSLSGSYQMSPVSGLTLTASQLESSGDAASQRTKLTSWLANWNTRLGTRVSVQLGARHSRFAGATSYSENAAYATLTQQF